MSRYLAEHCIKLKCPDKDALAVQHFEAFTAEQRRAGALPGFVSVGDLNGQVIDRYIAWRRRTGVVGETINRELATVRGALNWAWKEELVTSRPYIKQVPEDQCSGPRDLEWSPEQVAAILEAAWALPDRHHVHLFAITSLSTHARTDAILECNLDTQLRGRLIHWLAPGEKQTRKRRSTVPVAPTLAAWLEGRSGKLIRYRAETARRKWADPAIPEYFERDTWDIGRALGSAIVAAGIAHPSLGLVAPMLDGDGVQLVRRFTRRDPATGRIPEPQLQWRPIGTPNTFRHTCHTYLQTAGVPQAQIDLAAGHSGEKGSGRNYTHLRPEYLREFIEGIEAYWHHMDTLTRAHRRTQSGPKIVHLPISKAVSK
jgi:hypothetical protein